MTSHCEKRPCLPCYITRFFFKVGDKERVTLKLGFLGRKWFHLSDSRTIVSSKRDQGTDYTLQDKSCCIWLNNSKRILKRLKKKKNVIKHITFEILFNHEFPKTAAMIIHCTRIKTMKETHIKRLRLLMKWTNIKRVTNRLLLINLIIRRI